MSLMHELLTPRLRLTRFEPGDWGDFWSLYQEPRVMATLGGMLAEAKVREIFDRDLAHWQQHGFGRWIARDLATIRFMGRGGLRHFIVNDRPEVELSYAFMPEFWGQGIATELAATSVRVGFEQLGLTELACFTLPINQASRRVMEKVGFRYERDGIHANLPHIFFRLTAEQWRNECRENPRR